MDDLCRLSATAAVDLLRRRKVSPLELLDAAAARIAETEPSLNAIPTLCLERARDQAKALMRSPPADPPDHFLHGLPIVVKDNVEVKGVRCTFGSPIFADHVSPESDVVVQRLESNGALVVGKSNIPEFAAGGNTFNDVFGITRNPWNTDYTPGGSSGGTAAALAAGQVWLGTGNDFGGSIRTPASFCSLVGLRPTAGTVPRVQKQPYSPLNVEGPLARNVDGLRADAGMRGGATSARSAQCPDRAGQLHAGGREPVPPEADRPQPGSGHRAYCGAGSGPPVRAARGEAGRRGLRRRGGLPGSAGCGFHLPDAAWRRLRGQHEDVAGEGAPPAQAGRDRERRVRLGPDDR